MRKQKKRKDNKPVSVKTVTILSIAFGGLILALNFAFLREFEQIYAYVNLAGAFVVLGLPIFYRYNEYRKVRNIEDIFPRYLRDVTENISTGMTLPQAMRATRSVDYGAFTPYARELSAKVSWGIPLEKALHQLAKKTKSRTMNRNVQAISEAYRSGGTVDTILKSVAQSLQELEKIKKERYSSVYPQMINGYIIYIVFLGVMIGLSSILIPTFTQFGGSDQDYKSLFTDIFRSLAVIQGLFAGLAIGKMAEGSITAGLKHAFALGIVGYSALIIFI